MTATAGLPQVARQRPSTVLDTNCTQLALRVTSFLAREELLTPLAFRALPTEPETRLQFQAVSSPIPLARQLLQLQAAYPTRWSLPIPHPPARAPLTQCDTPRTPCRQPLAAAASPSTRPPATPW